MKKSIGSKILAGLTAGAMTVSTVFAEYVPVFAEQSVSTGGTVYFSISDDDAYVFSDTAAHDGEVMAYIPVSIDAIAQAIDLEEYGYQDYQYDEDGDDQYETTLFQGFLYVLENYYSGGTEELNVTGSSGSTYFQNGFWGHDENLTYYVNGAYPLESEAWGATSDHIVLHDGDFIDVSMYSDWDFYNDETAGYHYFTDEAGDISHEFQAIAGQPLTVGYARTSTDWNASYATSLVEDDAEVYIASELYADEADTVETEDGEAELTFEEPGIYYLWTYGAAGASGAIVSTPAYAKVTVEPAPVAETFADAVVRSQAGGVYLAAPTEVTISSLLAESYGYTDEVEGVSALDALVAAHELIFGEDFTPDTASMFLDVSSSGWVGTIFGEETMANGFLVNGGIPNDGTESPYGGYNGTMITTTPVEDEDVLDFFIYGSDYYADYMTYLTFAESAAAGSELEVEVNGAWISAGYMYADAEEMEAAAEPLENALLAWIDPESGEVIPIDDSYTDEDGKVTITVPEEVGFYQLSAYSNTEDEDDEVWCLLNPYWLEVTEAPDVPDVPDEPEIDTVTATIKYNTPSTALALYAMDDEEKENNLLAEITPEGTTYTVELEEGQYVAEAYTGEISNGTIVLDIDEDNQAFELFTVTAYCSTSGWTYGTDYTIEQLQVLSGGDKASVVREVSMGDSSTAGRKTFPVLMGDSYSFYGTPVGSRIEGYVPTYKQGVVTATNYTTASFTMSAKTGLSVTVPYADTDADGQNDYILEVGQMFNYYIYTYMDPITDDIDTEAGTETQTFETGKSAAYYYRVTNPLNDDAVTYGNYITCSADVNTAAVTTEDMKIGDAGLDKGTVIKDFSQNGYDTGDIFLNINEKGYLNLASGSTFNLYPFRNWLAIESISNAKVIEPDFHVEVLGDAVSVTEKTENNASKHSYEIKAEQPGTAIVLVTYDAMYDAIGMGGKPVFSAIWPENTGVFVVTVDGNPGIETGMTINEGLNTGAKLSKDAYDADLDVLYYAGDEGATYTFTPEAGTDVTMAVGQISGGKMTFGGFTSDGVTKNADGSVTLSGLKHGKTIVKLTNGGRTEYQVLKALKVTYTITNQNGDVVGTDAGLAEGAVIKANDELTFAFDRIYIPANKLSGIYNMSGSIKYTGEDGTSFSGTANQYLFASTAACQQIKVKIPKFWVNDTYTLKGLVFESGFGSAYGCHRQLTYEAGKAPNFTAVVGSGSFGSMPAITLPITETTFLSGAFTFVDEKGNELPANVGTISLKDFENSPVTVTEEGTFKASAGTYSYTVNAAGYEYAYGSVDLTDDGENSFEIVLQTSSEGAWDGAEMTQPQQDTDGTYLIGTGAELKWFQNEVTVNKAKTANAKLTADINLAKYPWTPIGTTSAQMGGTFDGAGYEIYNLYCSGASTLALFGCITGTVKDLTVSGEVIGTGGSLAGVVAYAQGQNASNPCQITNVVNNVNVTQNNTSGSSGNIAGIAGYTYYAVIENCTNNGTISTNSTSATATGYGGIVGYMMNYQESSVTGCKNTGAVTGRKNVGGILGYAGGNKPVIANCYNTGYISGNNYVAGLVGDLQGAAFAHGYNTGAVTAEAEEADLEPVANDSKSGNNTADSWYLNTFDGTAVNGTALSMADLKSRDIEGFGMTCDGTPALLWEDAQFHQKNEAGIVTAPTCTEEGYTSYICTVCGKEFKADPVPANGHTLAVSEQHVGYAIGTCSVCGIDLTVWDDERLQALSYDENAVTALSVTDDGAYPWKANADGNGLTSGNKGIDSSTSATDISFTLSGAAQVSFDYLVSSEARYDKLTITMTENGETATVANAISGEETGSYDELLPAGTYNLHLSFYKDSSSAGGKDLAAISNFTIVGDDEFVILQQPENIPSAQDGDTVSYTVVAKNAAAYQWEYSKNGTRWSDSAAAGADTATVSFKAATSNITNKYRCKVTGNDGTVLYTDVVTIENATTLKITQQPSDWDAADGKAATFSVTAENAVSYQWQYSKDGQKWYRSNAEGADTAEISLSVAPSNMANVYRCKVTGLDGKAVYTQTAGCTGVPVITAQPQSAAYAAGQTAIFTVEVAGAENCTYQWYYSKDGQKWYKSNAAGADTASLSVVMKDNTINNTYRCKITENDITVNSESAGFAQ